jgi:hypothetical protein
MTNRFIEKLGRFATLDAADVAELVHATARVGVWRRGRI